MGRGLEKPTGQRSRRAARSLSYQLLYYSGAIARARRRNRRYARILTYHGIAPEESPFTKGLDVTVKPTTFARQIDYLCRHYTVVSLAQLVESLVEGRMGERVVALTFDDGFGDNYTYAYPVLRERGLPATIFLVADAVDNRSLLWMHRLAFMVNTCGADQVLRTAESLLQKRLSLLNLRNKLTCDLDPASRDRLLDSMASELKASPEGSSSRDELYLTSDQLAEMKMNDISFGCHGATHSAFVCMPGSEQSTELQRSWAEIAQLTEGQAPAFAYPFGEPCHYTAETRKLALTTGHNWLLAGGGGWIGPASHPSTLDRIKVEEEPIQAFAARIEGVSLRSGFAGLSGGPPG